MGNRLQKYLDYIKKFVEHNSVFIPYCYDEKYKESVDVLQELINNYSKISQFDRAIFFNSKNLVVNGISYEQLEKALDLACEEIRNHKHCVSKKELEEECLKVPCKDCQYYVVGKKEWKEYLLKEVRDESRN